MNTSEIKQIARYLVMGGTTYALYIGLLFLLSEFIGAGEYISFIISFILANIYNYLAHYYITFSSKRHHLQTIRSFALVVLAGIIGGAAITELVKLWEDGYTLWVVSAYGLIWPIASYLLLRIKVFAHSDDL